MSSAYETFSYYPSENAERDYDNASPDTTTPLPAGFPSEITSPSGLVWDNTLDPNDQIHTLTGPDLEEIGAAVIAFQADPSLQLQDLSSTTFSLPNLAGKLETWRQSLYTGPGFQLLRGIKPDSLSDIQKIIVHAGLTSYFGNLRGYCTPFSNNTQVLAHVTDLQIKKGSPSPAHTNEAMTYHTDLGDIVSIFTLSNGFGTTIPDYDHGTFHLASSYTVYNQFAQNRRDVVKTLSDPFEMLPVQDGSNRVQPLLHYMPATAEGAERIIMQSFRRPFTRRSGPGLDPPQINALNALHFEAKKNSISIDFQDGDLLLFNNLALLHSRDSFKPTEVIGARHLWKLFIRDTKCGWAIPSVLLDQWGVLYNRRSDMLASGTTVTTETFVPDVTASPDEPPVDGWSQNG